MLPPCTWRLDALMCHILMIVATSAAKPLPSRVPLWLQVARAPGATLEQLQAQLAAFDREYAASAAAAGPVKWRRHAEFMRDT